MSDLTADLPLFHAAAFERSSEGPRLMGTRCRACGQLFHPQVSVCFECLGSDLEVVPLGRCGTLECFTTVHMPAARIAPPYSVGYVKLREGLRVFAPVVATQGAFASGMPMRLADFVLGPEGSEALAYCFVPDPGTRAP